MPNLESCSRGRSLPLLTLALILAADAGPARSAAFVGVSAVRAQWFENQTLPFFPVDPGELFGKSLVAGDFNGDGAMDLATGIPQDSGSTVDPQFGIGAVIVRWGIAGRGLATGVADTILTPYGQGSALPPESARDFGIALAAGDFNGDGRDDLAVGAPSSGLQSAGNFIQGAVLIHYGLPAGIQTDAEHLLLPGVNGLPDPPGEYERLGSALAAGDFDGDGWDDLAIGAPQGWCCSGCCPSSGAVIVVHGHPGGVYPISGYLLRQGADGIPDTGENVDNFGAALVAGNFNGDLRCSGATCHPVDDLAIGVPGEDGEGAVMTVFGSEFGLIFTLHSYLGQFALGGSFGEAEDRFGSHLAAGDFDGDGLDELVIGTPNEDLGAANAATDAGEVTVVRGLSAVAPYFSAAVRYSQGSIFGEAVYDEVNDRFGSAVAAADFDGDGFDDLAIGIAGEDTAGPDRGGFTMLNGGAQGLYTRFRFLTAGSQGIPPAVQNSSDMGAALTIGDFDGDGHADLAIGLPYRNVGAIPDAGAVTVLYGSAFSDGFESGSAGDWSLVEP